jgi:hypothetical protein
MSGIFTKLHGTTTDSFKIGLNNHRLILKGSTSSAKTTELLDRDGNKFATNSTIFFTAYIIGRGSNTAAFEIKGCYLEGTTTVTGFVVNTYVDTAEFQEPTLAFDANGVMTLSCTGVNGDTIEWTAAVDVVSI